MSEKRVFIGFGTRFGATEEISHRIVKLLENSGITTQVENLRKNKNPPSSQEFDGVIIASGMKISKWTKEPKKYIKKYSDMLKNPDKIFGMFVCSILAVQDYEQAKADYLQKTLEDNDIPDDQNHIVYDAFGGVMDFSKDTNLRLFDKRALQMAAMGMEKDSEGAFQYDPNGKNDFRDWEKITEFATKFKNMLLR